MKWNEWNGDHILIDSSEFEIEFGSCLKMFLVIITYEQAKIWVPRNFQPIEKADGIIYFKKHSSITNCELAYKLKWKHALIFANRKTNPL